MPCRTAYLIHEPTITEVTEKAVPVLVDKKNFRWETHYERFLFPEYKVGFTVDYGACCGVDFYEKRFQFKEDAEAEIAKVYANEHEWIKYDPDFIEDTEDEDA